MNNDTLFPVATLIFVVIYIISNFLDIPMFKRSITDHSLKVSGVEDDSNFLKKMVSYFLHRRKYKKIRMTGIATGYFYAQNSGLNNTLIYKQIWDDIYDQELDDKQVAEFFTYFKKGKTYKFPQVAELFTENRDIWDSENDRIATFTRIVSIFFMDNLLSPKEIDLYYRFGKTVELSKQVLDRLFTSFINKYSFVKDEDSNCYRSYLFEEDYFADGAWARTDGGRQEQQEHEQQQGQKRGYYWYEDGYTDSRRRAQQENSSGSSNSGSQGYSGGKSGGTSYSEEKLDQAYLLLQITMDTPEAEAKRAYHRMMHRYHPDRAYGKKLGEAEIQRYKELCQQIQNAWETVCKARNW